MSRYNTQLNTPGLNLRPRDTGSQLVSALGSVFSGTTAAASASARIQRAKDAEKARIRNEHNQIAQQAFSQAERERIAQQRQQNQAAKDKVSDSIYNTLMDPRAENPEWLLQQGIAGVDNALTQQEEDQWQQFTLSQMGAVRRLRERETTQEAANEERSFKRQVRLMMAQADAGIDFDELLRDPDQMLGNLTDYYMTSAFTAAGDDIDNPEYRAMLADAAVDHSLARFKAEGIPRIQQARQVTSEAMGYEMLQNSEEAFFEGSLSGSEFVSEMTGVFSRQFSNRTPRQQQDLAKNMAEQTVERLAQLPGDISATVAGERFEEFVASLPPGTFNEVTKEKLRQRFFQQSLPAQASSRATQLLEKKMREFETQTNIAGVPKTTDEAMLDMLETTSDGETDMYGLIEDQIGTEMGLDPNNEDHLFAFSTIRKQIDSARAKALSYQSRVLKNESALALWNSGQITTNTQSNDAYKATSFGSGRFNEYESSQIRAVMTAVGMDPDAYGIVQGSPVDFTTLHSQEGGEQVVDTIARQFATGLNRNPLANRPEGLRDRIENLLLSQTEGNLRAVQTIYGTLNPAHRKRLKEGMSPSVRARLIGLHYGSVFGKTDQEIEQVMSLPDAVLQEAANNYSIVQGADPRSIERGKSQKVKVLEEILETNFGSVEEGKSLLVNNPMGEYYFQQVEIYARAVASEEGRNYPSAEDYRAGSIRAWTEMEDDGATLATYLSPEGNPISQWVADPVGHIPDGTDISDLWAQQNRNADRNSPEFQSLAGSLGIDYVFDSTGGENAFSELALTMGIQEAGDNPALYQGMLPERNDSVEWRPMNPNTEIARQMMRSTGGGVAMVPYYRRMVDGREKLIQLVRPDLNSAWPFVASMNAVTGIEPPPPGFLERMREAQRTAGPIFTEESRRQMEGQKVVIQGMIDSVLEILTAGQLDTVTFNDRNR